jgi:MFS family permease
VAITLGFAIRVLGGDEVGAGALALLLGAAALAWVAALAVYATVREPPGAADDALDAGWLRHALALLRADAPFRRFVLVRTLLLVSALSPPFVVTLGAQETGVGLANLGPFLVSAGLAGLAGGWVFGRLADRSSRRLMVLGAAVASAVVLLLLAVRTVPAIGRTWWLYPLAYLLLALAHTGVRVARKTYVVDLASGNRRTDYVAVSNTAMGVLLLVTGGISSLLAQVGVGLALGFLALLGLGGVVAARALPEVSLTR